VSIVTPSFNQGVFLEETIRSVLLQGYPRLEYFILDGGSTDHSVDIIRRYEPWLTSWVSEPDAGQSDAINRGFARATGSVLGWLNSDDYFAPEALAVAARTLHSGGPAVGAVVGVGHKVDGRGRIFSSPRPAAVTRESLLDWCSGHNFMQPACLFTSAAWAMAGPLRVDLDYCMDLALWLRIAEDHAFLVVPETLAFINTHDEAKTIKMRHRMFAEIALLLAADAGAWNKGRTLLFSVLDSDDTQKRGVQHLSQALVREIRRRVQALVRRSPSQ
jgi:glycosyltransferase involved in cell wall biosynthesis